MRADAAVHVRCCASAPGAQSAGNVSCTPRRNDASATRPHISPDAAAVHLIQMRSGKRGNMMDMNVYRMSVNEVGVSCMWYATWYEY